MKKFVVDYRHDGELYSLILSADSWQDAEKRLNSISMGQVIGSDAMEIPAAPGFGLLTRFLCWFRNARRI